MQQPSMLIKLERKVCHQYKCFNFDNLPIYFENSKQEFKINKVNFPPKWLSVTQCQHHYTVALLKRKRVDCNYKWWKTYLGKRIINSQAFYISFDAFHWRFCVLFTSRHITSSNFWPVKWPQMTWQVVNKMMLHKKYNR